jgi:hypothetical protein
MIPYYLDLPQLDIPQELVESKYIQHPMDFLSPSGSGMGGKNFQYRGVPTNWYSIVKTYLESVLTIPVGSLTLLNTNKDASSPWHAEGPNTFGRRCALNFMVSGDFEKSYVQWCTRGEEELETNDSRGAWWEDDNMKVLAEHRMTLGKPTIYNTMHWHRVFNFTDQDRMVISMAINEPIEKIYEMYESGELFK